MAQDPTAVNGYKGAFDDAMKNVRRLMLELEHDVEVRDALAWVEEEMVRRSELKRREAEQRLIEAAAQAEERSILAAAHAKDKIRHEAEKSTRRTDLIMRIAELRS